MSLPSPYTELPDAVVRAIRSASKPFIVLQSSRYSRASTNDSNVFAQTDRATHSSLVMRTKTPLPEEKDNKLYVTHVLPSTWSEQYRQAFEELPDVPSKRLWGLVSTVLNLLEEAEGKDTLYDVNASAAIVEWNDRFSTALRGDVRALVSDLQCTHPSHLDTAAVETIGSEVLSHIEDAFLTGHFEVAATLMDALLSFLRRGRSVLLSAEVETALADVRRLLATAFHDPDSHEDVWVRGANEQLQESRNLFVDTANASTNSSSEDDGGDNSSGVSVIDGLVGDLCATCVDVLILITKDARRLVERCRTSGKSAVDFLVAMCAIIQPYAPLPHVAGIFAEYVRYWYMEDGDNSTKDTECANIESHTNKSEDGLHQQWYYDAIQTVLEAVSFTSMVDAMERVAQISSETFRETLAAVGAEHIETNRQQPTWPRSSNSDNNNSEDVVDDGDDSVSDTVSLAEVTDIHRYTNSTSSDCFVHNAFARRLILACMAAHVADLCAPAAVAASAADMQLTFTRNSLVAAYAELFAFHERTWRVAGLYACYSPLLNPRFLFDVVVHVAPLAAIDEGTYRSLRAFLHTRWCTHSEHQTAVRAKVESILPANPTVAKWWTGMDFCYAEAYRKVHCCLLATFTHKRQWAHAAWLAVEAGLTDVLQSRLRRILASGDALTNEEFYAIGCAVQRGFVAAADSSCAAGELVRYLCAAATVAAYRQAATAANAAVNNSHRRASSDGEQAAVVATSVCLRAIEAALKCFDACEVMLHPATTFTLVEHGATLLLTLRRLMRDPITGDTTASMHVSSCVLPLLVEAYQLSNIHFGRTDPALEKRSRALGEQLATVHQTCIG